MKSIIEIIGSDINKVKPALLAFDKILASDILVDDMRLSTKIVKDANSEQVDMMLKYGSITSQLKALVEFVEVEVRKRKTIIYRDLVHNSNISYTDREREKLLDDDEEYVKLQVLLLEVKERYDNFRNIMDTLSARGYALMNITKLLIDNVEYTVL